MRLVFHRLAERELTDALRLTEAPGTTAPRRIERQIEDARGDLEADGIDPTERLESFGSSTARKSLKHATIDLLTLRQ